MKQAARIEIEVWTNHFLGTSEKCEQLLQLLEAVDGGRWQPDRWNECEPIRLPFTRESLQSICSAWTEKSGGSITNDLFFKKRKPFAEIWAQCWKAKVPSLNRVRLSLDAGEFQEKNGGERVSDIVLRFVEWAEAVYATAWHSQQMHWRVAQGTPLARLKSIDWLTFFGKPYLELFGGEQRVLSGAWYGARQVSGGLLLLASERFDSAEMTHSDRTLLELENYLGQDSFAREGFPKVTCRVPAFDLSETVTQPNGQELRSGSNVLGPTLVLDDANRPIAVLTMSKPSPKPDGSS